MDKHRQVFLEEAAELLAELESALLELEETPEDKGLIGRVFRAMHTIKGSGAMFGFDRVSKFTHEIETVFDLVRNDRMRVSRELINLTLSARDLIKAMLDAPAGLSPEAEQQSALIVASLKSLVPSAPAAQPLPAPQPSSQTPQTPDGAAATYRIYFKPAQGIFATGANIDLLLRELHGLGKCTVVALTDAVPLLNDMDPEGCYTAWNILLTTDRGINAVKDVFLFVQDDAELNIRVAEVMNAAEQADDRVYDKKLGDILVERGDITPDTVREALSKQSRFGQVLVGMGAVSPDKVATALAEQEHLKGVRENRRKEESALSVRVPAEKLDRLVDLVGELVTVQARFSQAASKKGSARDQFLPISEEVERLTAELRDNAMSIRMLPIGTTFSKFKRLVRDLSSQLGKEVELTTEGAETELDKTVIERLGDPLVHLIRNSIDHGIEPPDDRIAAGKPRQGLIHLAAQHSGAHVLIRISDNGAGIDPLVVRAKAVEKGLLAPAEERTEQELFDLLFAPGFSTAQSVTSVSGRGVGMDVVKKTINDLRGTVEIASEKGKGTTMTLRLPLTLAIIDGFLTTIGAEHFVFPLSLVEECVELRRDQRNRAMKRCLADVRGQIVPYIRLREQFRIGSEPPAIEQIVITRVNERRLGFVVDRIIGGHQTVIKNLGRFYHDVKGVSGATILGDGTVALILDIPMLVRDAEEEAAAVRQQGCA
jgi:two-component system, chemotaxis family, sensor kinase CheA